CQHQGCTAVHHLSPMQYLTALCESIVYIHLQDASAINTLLECVVKRIPIIINKHPAVVEVLGDSYPLYANDHVEAAYILENQPDKIEYAVTYLSMVDTNRYHYQHFHY